MRAAATARPAGSATSSCRRRSPSSERAKPTRKTSNTSGDLSATIIETSRCGLGITSPNPVLTTLKGFPLIYSTMTKPNRDGIRDTFDIQAAIDGARKIAKRRSYIFDKDYSQ